MRRWLLVPALALVGPLVAAPAVAVADTGFGTAPVSAPDRTTAPGGPPQLLAVAVGHHDTYDRVVFRFSSQVPGYSVHYVPSVTADPSGKPVPLAGAAFLAVTMHSVASAQAGAPPAPQGTQRPGFPELRELAGAGDFEGYVSFGLGLTAKTGFRVFTLTGPDRLVVDVALPAQAAPAATTARALPRTGLPALRLAGAALLLAAVGGLLVRLGRKAGTPGQIGA